MTENRLTIISEPYMKQYGKVRHSTVKCQCVCGKIKEFKLNVIKREDTKSCGCLQIEKRKSNTRTHGLSKHKLFRIWNNIKNRCLNSKISDYNRYGKRGIAICDEWKNDFKTFYDWAIKNGWTAELTIDRINNDGNYEPDNCRCVTRKVQANNTRRNQRITAFGETKTIAEWSRDERCQVKYKTLFNRIKYCHWNIEDAITKELK